MAQQLGTMATLPEDLSLIPSIHMADHVTPVPGHPMPSSGLQGHHTHIAQTYIQVNTHTHKKKKIITEYILLKML